jgi:hypothetical protein
MGKSSTAKRRSAVRLLVTRPAHGISLDKKVPSRLERRSHAAVCALEPASDIDICRGQSEMLDPDGPIREADINDWNPAEQPNLAS